MRHEKLMMEQFVEFCNDEARFRHNERISNWCRKRAVMLLAYAFGVRTIWHKRNENGIVDLDVWSRKVRGLPVN
jgi:hypothetical protein